MDFQKIAKDLKVQRHTASKAVKQYKEHLSIEIKSYSGRKKGLTDFGKVNEFQQPFRRAPNTSIRKAPRKVKCSDYFVRKAIANAGLISYTVQKVHDCNTVKNLEAKVQVKKLK